MRDDREDLIGYGPDCCGEDDSAYRHARFNAAMERLDAEVVAHETPDPDFSPLDEIMPSIGEPAAPNEPRFGERLRAVAGEIECGTLTATEADYIADAIDRDATTERQQAFALHRDCQERLKRNLRRQVEETVERLRYSLSGHCLPPTAPDPEAPEDILVDVVAAEPFLEELARIFGERAEEPAPCLGGGTVISALLARGACPACGGVFRQTSGRACGLNQWALPEHFPATGLAREHEPAAERRKP